MIISDATGQRPWAGEIKEIIEETLPEFDPECYLCPGVKRASGIKNPSYTKPYTFNNDFPSFSLDAPEENRDGMLERDDMLEMIAPAKGICRVTCFSPMHNITLAEMTTGQIRDVISLWQDEYKDLGSRKEIKNVLIFENKGKVTGASNPHPHGQIYATGFVPRIVEQERDSFIMYKKKMKTCLMCDLVNKENVNKDRIICENEHFIAFIPFFARFAYETYFVPKRHIADITGFDTEETDAMADIYKTLMVKYDNLYEMSFPNITMLHNAPTDGNNDNKEFHFHMEFYPPLRSPDKQKYLAGFEAGGGNIINPVLPEKAAKQLGQTDTVHYKKSD